MLDNWINPTPAVSYLEKFACLNIEAIIAPSKLKANANKRQVALVGWGPGIQKIRDAFYKMNFSSMELTITDLGDIRNNDVGLMTAAYKELIEQNIFPIILDPSPNASISLANALKFLEIPNNQGVITPRTDRASKGYKLISNLLEDEKVNRLSIIGHQKHYANPAYQLIPKLDPAGLMSLGQLRDNLKEVEPLLRDLTSLSFDLSSIRASDTIGLKNQHSIGLFSEEACKILQYAASSSKLRSIHLFGFHMENNGGISPELIACLIWYSIAGMQVIERYSNTKNEMNRYIVELSEIDAKIQFWKNENSERWWVEIPNPSISHNLVPCSENEYIMACKNKISDRLFHLLSNR